MRLTIKKVTRVAEWLTLLLLVAVVITAAMVPTILLSPLGTIVWLALFAAGMLAALVAIFCWIAQGVTWLRCRLSEEQP